MLKTKGRSDSTWGGDMVVSILDQVFQTYDGGVSGQSLGEGVNPTYARPHSLRCTPS